MSRLDVDECYICHQVAEWECDWSECEQGKAKGFGHAKMCDSHISFLGGIPKPGKWSCPGCANARVKSDRADARYVYCEFHARMDGGGPDGDNEETYCVHCEPLAWQAWWDETYPNTTVEIPGQEVFPL